MKKKIKKTEKKMIIAKAEVMTFEKEDQRATVATNGLRHVTQVGMVLKEHQTLIQAISYIESKGYNINTSECYGL